ncbi:MAG TPA: restriction endonuclease subunit S [Halothiobacillus sp.]|nr:restriction endonuclease subunit S [Halothiobacillus sp.]
MSEWSTVTLADIADIRFSNVDKKSLAGEKSVRLCNYMDTYSNNYITADLPFMEATATVPEMERFKVEKGDNIITKDSETPDDIGIPAVVIDDIPNLICGYHLALIKPKRDKVDPIYLSKQLGSKQSAIYFSRLANGSTRYGLSSSAIASIKIPLAPFVEQRRIAEVLFTLDKAIEKTEALIAKYQQIKAGLMHDLFTRGVTADGKLRPPREQAPELYQQTPIGWIPKDWEVESIDSLVVRVGSGITPTGGNEVYLTEGIIFVRSQNVTHQGLDLSDVAFIDEETHQRMAASEVLPFDVLLNITGASIGRCCYLPDGLGPTNTNQHVCCIRFARPNETDAKFLSMVLSSPIGQNQIFRLNAGGNREGLNYQQLRAFIVPWPQQDERLKIAVRLNFAEGHISVERQLLIKLRQQKHGLMHDLLTGRVRVKV